MYLSIAFKKITRLNTIQSNDARNPKEPKQTLKKTKESLRTLLKPEEPYQDIRNPKKP